MSVRIGNTNAAAGSGGSGNISFTRTLEATIGYEDRMCTFFASDMGDVEEYSQYGDDYAIVIESISSGTDGQIVYTLGSIYQYTTIPTNRLMLGGKYFYIDFSSSKSEVWGYHKFNDEDDIQRYALKQIAFSGSYKYIKISVAPKYKQNLTGSTKSVRGHMRVALLLWDTEANEYVAYDTGDLITDYTSVNNNYYTSFGGVAITFERKYAICGIQVKYAYFDNLEVEPQPVGELTY